MDWKRGEVASQGNHLCSWEVWGWWMGLGSPGPYGQVRGWMLLGGLGLGDGAGCSWARWAGAPPGPPRTLGAPGSYGAGGWGWVLLGSMGRRSPEPLRTLLA